MCVCVCVYTGSFKSLPFSPTSEMNRNFGKWQNTYSMISKGVLFWWLNFISGGDRGRVWNFKSEGRSHVTSLKTSHQDLEIDRKRFVLKWLIKNMHCGIKIYQLDFGSRSEIWKKAQYIFCQFYCYPLYLRQFWASSQREQKVIFIGIINKISNGEIGLMAHRWKKL